MTEPKPLQSLIDSRKAIARKLREPFKEHQINKLPKPTVRAETYKTLDKGACGICGGWHAKTNTIHLDYVGHAMVTDRLLDVDREWNWEPLAFTEAGLPQFDGNGGLWIKLTVGGMTRLGYGNAAEKRIGDAGNREKEVIGDAIRNAAMRFGVALDMWHKGDLHASIHENEEVPKKRAKPAPKKPKPAPVPEEDEIRVDVVPFIGEHKDAMNAIYLVAGAAEWAKLGRELAAANFTDKERDEQRLAMEERRKDLRGEKS